MNRITKYLTLAAALLALAGCNKEPVADGGAITVDATLGAATKVSADGDAFTSGDQIAVYAWLGGATQMPDTRVVDGVVNTFDGTSWTPATMMRWQVTDDPHYFLGIYPAPKAAITDFAAVPYTLDPAKYVESDLLLATTPDGVKNTGAAVPLAFHHAMAKLTVNLKFRSQWATTPDVSAVTVTAKSTASVNYLTQAVTATGTASAVSVPAAASAASGYALGFSGLQVPQTGVRKVTVTIDGKNYVYEAGEDITLAAGRNTTLNLIVGRDKIDLSGISLSPWTPEDPLDTGNAEMNMRFTPLTIEALVAGAKVTFKLASGGVKNPSAPEYRIFDGTKWGDWTVYSDAITLTNVGDKVQFRGNNATYAALDGSDTFGYTTYVASSSINLSANCYVYGNIMSLTDGDRFSTADELRGDYTFKYLFSNNSYLQLDASRPLLLPAIKLTKQCYDGMFESCSALTDVLPALPATELKEHCYFQMFLNCYNLTTVPEGYLPATQLAPLCYEDMFYNCGELTTVPANLLPAETLANSCYNGMFGECEKLTAAPVLPAKTLVNSCYYGMFENCLKLNSVTCLATDITDSSSTSKWLDGVAAAGMFTCPASMAGTWPQNSINGIPTGWTQVDYVAL